VSLVQPMKTAPVPGVLVCLLFFSACTSDVAVPRPSAPVSPEPAEDGPFVRSCQLAVVGDLGPTWRRGAAVSGPIALVGVAAYRKASTRSFAPRGGRYPSLKVLAVVERGAPVTMMVASSSASRSDSCTTNPCGGTTTATVIRRGTSGDVRAVRGPADQSVQRVFLDARTSMRWARGMAGG
jgi:hypothetical protein